MPALDRLENRVKESNDLAFKARNKFKDHGGETYANALGYHEGRASAFNESHREMKALLARLQNRYQNGHLSIDDFQ